VNNSFTANTSTVLAVHCLGPRVGSKGGDWGDHHPLNPTKGTLFTMISYNSEKIISDIRPFCRLLFCHSCEI